MKFTVNKQRYFMENRNQLLPTLRSAVYFGCFLCYRDRPPGRRCDSVYIHSLQMADRQMNVWMFFSFI